MGCQEPWKVNIIMSSSFIVLINLCLLCISAYMTFNFKPKVQYGDFTQETRFQTLYHTSLKYTECPSHCQWFILKLTRFTFPCFWYFPWKILSKTKDFYTGLRWGKKTKPNSCFLECERDTNFDVTTIRYEYSEEWKCSQLHSQQKQPCDIKFCITFAKAGSVNQASIASSTIYLKTSASK